MERFDWMVEIWKVAGVTSPPAHWIKELFLNGMINWEVMGVYLYQKVLQVSYKDTQDIIYSLSSCKYCQVIKLILLLLLPTNFNGKIIILNQLRESFEDILCFSKEYSFLSHTFSSILQVMLWKIFFKTHLYLSNFSI